MNSENLIRARHHLVFLAALIVGSVLIYFLNDIDLRKQGYGMINLKETAPASAGKLKTRELNAKEKEWAKVAWRYFENNYNENTGMVNSVDKYPSTTLWDSGNYLSALIAAHDLGIITKEEFDRRLDAILSTLATLPLYKGKLPNKAYNTQTLQMTDYANKATNEGIGWSVIDIGRILSPLSYITINFPAHNEQIKKILAAWDFTSLQKNGELYGAVRKKDRTYMLQEGRLGYEQFSSKVFALFAVESFSSMRYDRFLDFVDIYGVDVPFDIRDSDTFRANNYVLMEPYMLDGLEFGWDYISREFSYRLYEVQEERYKRTGIPTAVTEDHIDQKPYFLYNSIFVNNQSWAAVDETGKAYPDLNLLSTKASFAMYALYRTKYTRMLVDKVGELQGERGWYAGIYEKSGKPNKAVTCNTNAVILESLFYIKNGPLLGHK